MVESKLSRCQSVGAIVIVVVVCVMSRCVMSLLCHVVIMSSCVILSTTVSKSLLIKKNKNHICLNQSINMEVGPVDVSFKTPCTAVIAGGTGASDYMLV